MMMRNREKVWIWACLWLMGVQAPVFGAALQAVDDKGVVTLSNEQGKIT